MTVSSRIVVILAALLSALTGGCQSSVPARAPTLAITDVNVVDVTRGQVIPHQTVLIEGDRITVVDDDATVEVPEGSRTVDASGQFMIPGLWDMHGHFERANYDQVVRLLVANGVLGVRDMGSDLDDMRQVQARIGSGALPHLRTQIPGHMLDGPTDNWPLRITVSSPEEGEIAVQNKVDQGVDFIKVHQQLDGETYLAIARAAVAQDIEFAGHVPGGLSAIQASQAGQGTIEHLSGTPFCTEDDCSALSESIDVFLESGVHHVPTLSVYDAQERNYTTGRIPDGLEAYLSSELLNWWAFQDSVNAKLIPPEFDEPRIREMMIGLRRGALQLTRALHEAGVPILTGTDMSFIGVVAGFSMHSELGFLVEAGLSTAEALRAATVAPVTYLGLQDDLGSVEAGKLADVVVLAQNPLDDISAVNQIIAVITNGDFLDRDTLDAMLEMTRNR